VCYGGYCVATAKRVLVRTCARGVCQQLHQPRDDARVDDRLDARVLAVGEVAEAPRSVRDDVGVRRVQQVHQRGDERPHALQRRQRLPAAEVRQRPRAVLQHRVVVGVLDVQQQRLRRAGRRQDEVAKRRAVARDVAEAPRALLAALWWGTCTNGGCKCETGGACE
jgi:hypothetical protein